MLHKINISDLVLTAPSGYNVCLRVGGLDVKIGIVLKAVRTIGVPFLVAENPCVSRSLRRMYGADCGGFGAVICSSYIWGLRLKLPRVFCGSSGSYVGNFPQRSFERL